MDKYLFLFYDSSNVLCGWFSVSELIVSSLDEGYLLLRARSMCAELGFSKVCVYRCDDPLSSGAVLILDSCVEDV